MRIFIFCVWVSVVLSGCDFGETFDQDGLQVDFALLSVSGSRRVNFNLLDTVIVHFSVTNCSDREITYYYTGTPVILKIARGDSVVGTSVDGLVFAQVVHSRVLGAGQSLTLDWMVPNGPWGDHTVILTPGTYLALVDCALFKTMPFAQPNPLQFRVYPGNV